LAYILLKVCGGDGSIGWVLKEIDNLDLHKQVRGDRNPRIASALS
jgi:hypothetical protein